MPTDPIEKYIKTVLGSPVKVKKTVKTTYGTATKYLCVDCGKSARYWTNHNLNLQPRCSLCRRQFHEKEHVKHNCKHNYFIPIMFRNEYEFKFCRYCQTYRLEHK